MQVNFKKSTMSEHVTHLETLREEINIMTEKKMDLERRIEVSCLPLDKERIEVSCLP